MLCHTYSLQTPISMQNARYAYPYPNLTTQKKLHTFCQTTILLKNGLLLNPLGKPLPSSPLATSMSPPTGSISLSLFPAIAASTSNSPIFQARTIHSEIAAPRYMKPVKRMAPV